LNLTNCKCVFASLQVYKIKKIRNYKLIITNLQLNKLQEHICEFVQVYKFANIQCYKLQVHFCIFTNLHMLNLHIFILAYTAKL